VEREHEDAATKCPANRGEARRGDLLEDRHHEAERAALVALSLGEREAVLEVLLERRVERALLLFHRERLGVDPAPRKER